MGTDRSSGDLRGFLVHDPRITFDNVVAKTDATVPSTYTEAGPFPGPAVDGTNPALVLRTSGTQSGDGDLEILTRRAGGVGRGQAGFVWRDRAAGDTATEYKGEDPPAITTGWETLLYTTSAEGVTIRPTVIRLQSGKLLASYSVTTLGVVRISRYSPATSAWTSVNLTPTNAGSGYLAAAVTLCQLASGRVLAFCSANDLQQVDVYYSDDEGTTWTAGGYRILNVGVQDSTVTAPSGINDLRAAVSELGDVVLFVLWDNATTAQTTATQYGSSDNGASFYQVVEDWEVTAGKSIEALDVIALAGGGFCVLYIDEQPANDNLERVRIGSAFDAVTSAEVAEIDAGITALDDATGWRDEDGILWLICNDAVTASGLRLGQMYRSVDGGQTWTDAHAGHGTLAQHTGTTTTNRFQSWSATSLGGRTALVSRWTGGTSSYDPNSVGVIWYGGPSAHTAPAADVTWAGITAEDYADAAYIPWGSLTRPGRSWLPMELPTAVNWTTAGGGALGTLASPGCLLIDTAAGDRYYYIDISDDNTTQLFAEFEVSIETGEGSVAAEEVAFVCRIASAATFTYEVEVRLSASGYRLYDPNAAANIGSTVSVDFTTAKRVRIAMDKGAIKTWWCAPAHVREWAYGVGGTVADGGAGVANLIAFGHTGATTSTSRWFFVGYNYWPGRWGPTQTVGIADDWDNPDDLRPRSFSAEPGYLYDGVHLAAVGGPTWVGDTARLKARYEFPVQAITPDQSPSPQRGWRSTADSANYAIVYDLESEAGFSSSGWASSSIGVFVRDSNLANIKLQGWSGAAWVDIVEAVSTTGYSALPYVRRGRFLVPDTGASSDRWLFHDAHAGDAAFLDEAGADLYRTIAHNAEGAWRGSTKRARIELDTDLLSGSEAASGSLTIRRRNFGAVIHNQTPTYRYVRLYIPAQDTPEGYYRIGSIVVGPVFVFGLQYGRGWSDERVGSVELRTDDAGFRSARVRGRARRAVELSWSDQPQDTTRAWDTAPVPDYVTGVDAGDPVASLADTAYQVLGLIDRVDAPALPLVYLGRIPRGSGTHSFCQDREWLYGRVVSEAVGLDHVTGDEGDSVVLRGGRLRIEEET